MNGAPSLSVVLATHNRRDVVLATLNRLRVPGVLPAAHEIIVVDNASADGTAAALARHDVRAILLRRNRGACAREYGLRSARAPLILMLDDDSFPRPGCVERMAEHFTRHPRLAAASFLAHLPDGSQECSALPHVFIGCGVGLRTAALRACGGLDLSFFMAAEEYDLSFKLLAGGWGVETFDDLHVEHLKSPAGRRSDRIACYDIRNNLRVVARYLGGEHAAAYRHDWMLRYRWLAERHGHETANARGERAGRFRALIDSCTRQRRLPPWALEGVFGWSAIERRLRALAESGARRIVLADWGKNVYAFVRGARAAGLEICAIADDRFAAPGRCYRGLPIVQVDEALGLAVHAWVVSNTSFVHADVTAAALRARTPLPVLNWYGLARSDSLSAVRRSAALHAHG
ncbi:MAG: glycosyltransferase [Phycisphaerae bacterium]|nr:glycosyltransferase [Phycisphaerae bacterium]MCZ2399547.1 glycosyltransferase [Phycisphaerae bacterium]